MEIINFENTSFNNIAYAFLKAFADYDISIDKEQLRAMLRRRGFSPVLSFGAVDNG